VKYSMDVAAISDVGLKRKNNEDSFYYNVSTKHPCLALYLVADGMGGHASGEKASRVACREMAAVLDDQHCLSHDSKVLCRLMDAYVHRAHREIVGLGELHEDDKGMGTTLTSLLFSGHHAVYAHVGDSRLYAYHQGVLTQLSRDHTQAQILVQMGRLDADKASEHHLNQVLYQALGTDSVLDEDLEVETGLLDLSKVELLLLCSDGLYDMVPDEEISMILQSDSSLQHKAECLKEKALAHGGYDNVTVMLLAVHREKGFLSHLKEVFS